MNATTADAFAEHFARRQAVAQTFPADLQDIIKHRRSRDATTRFVRKLDGILSCISANPDLED
jgi:hypothetical protein